MPRVQQLHSAAKVFANGLLAFFYPEVCQVCKQHRAAVEQSYVCENCRSKIRFIERPFCEHCGVPFQGAITSTFECANCKDLDWAFSAARSAVLAKDTVLEVIHQYKYKHALWFEGFLAQLLIESAGPDLAGTHWDWIVPVPLHPSKQREREFNQAERLARALSKAMGVPVNTSLIRRQVATRTQTQLSRAERLLNVRKAFVPRKGALCRGANIVVVDDVFTTGATTGACAEALRSIGAAEVRVWTVARGL